jgi:hypothetical protein
MISRKQQSDKRGQAALAMEQTIDEWFLRRIQVKERDRLAWGKG